jgi:hypothetical protein
MNLGPLQLNPTGFNPKALQATDQSGISGLGSATLAPVAATRIQTSGAPVFLPLWTPELDWAGPGGRVGASRVTNPCALPEKNYDETPRRTTCLSETPLTF